MFCLTSSSGLLPPPKNLVGVSSGDNSQKLRRRFIILSVLLVLLPLSILIGAASSLESKTFINGAPSVGLFPPDPDVEMYAEAVAIDPIARTMVMDWYTRLPVHTLNCSEYLSKPKIREFYMPRTLMETSGTGWSDSTSESNVRLFTLNSTARCLDADTAAFSSFRTVTKLLSARGGIFTPNTSGVSSLQNYPFDKYWAPFSLSLVDPDTGRSRSPAISHFAGTAVNFEVILDSSIASPSRTGDTELVLNLFIKRSKAVQVYAVGAAVTFWLATTAFLIIVAATLVYSWDHVFLAMLIVPVGALFAFSSIRAHLPGAPDGFGTTLDIHSILPVLLILSCCSFSIPLIVLYRRVSQIADFKRGDSMPPSIDES